jgi:hypothetical protein
LTGTLASLVSSPFAGVIQISSNCAAGPVQAMVIGAPAGVRAGAETVTGRIATSSTRVASTASSAGW